MTVLLFLPTKCCKCRNYPSHRVVLKPIHFNHSADVPQLLPFDTMRVVARGAPAWATAKGDRASSDKGDTPQPVSLQGALGWPNCHLKAKFMKSTRVPAREDT
jgi:hypothetical protein